MPGFLPEGYFTTCGDLLQVIGQNLRDRAVPLTALGLSVGRNYSAGGLLVVSRTNNGASGRTRWTADELSSPAKRACVIGELHDETFDNEFLRDYSSAFWNAARHVGESIHRYADFWADHICWTNLCKIAPADGASPSAELELLQRPLCARLLQMEVDAVRPSVVLVLTGFGWYGYFAEALALPVRRFDTLVEATARKNGTYWIFAHRPQGPADPLRAQLDRALAQSHDRPWKTAAAIAP